MAVKKNYQSLGHSKPQHACSRVWKPGVQNQGASQPPRVRSPALPAPLSAPATWAASVRALVNLLCVSLSTMSGAAGIIQTTLPLKLLSCLLPGSV